MSIEDRRRRSEKKASVEMKGQGSSEEKFTVLFVCTGNSCRSPMAEGILKALLPAYIVEWTIVESAGTLGLSGVPATEEAVAVAAEKGIDISGHRARPAGVRLVEDADLILVMEPSHKEWLLRVSPEAGAKIHPLAGFAANGPVQGGGIVRDPIGGSVEVYRGCFAEIYAHVQRALSTIEEMARKKIGRRSGSS